MAQSTPHPIDDPASDAAVLLLRVGLAVLGLVIPVSTAMSRRALFILLPVGAGLVLVAGLLLSDVPIRRRIAAALLSTAAFWGIALIGWTALSLIWSPVGHLGIEKLAKSAGTMALVVVATTFLPERTRTSNLNLFPLGILAAVGVTLYIALTSQDAFQVQGDDSTLQRAIVTLVVLVWPALAAMAIRGRFAAAAIVVLAVMLAAMAAWSTAALTALALGSVAFVIATGAPGRVGRVLGVAAAALVLIGPAVPFGVALVLRLVPSVVADRLPDLQPTIESMRVWADIVLGQPLRLLTGHGIDMASVAPSVGFLPDATPHSFLFEIWYDFGLVGAVLTALLLRSAFGIVGRLSPTVAPFLIAEFMAMLTIVITGLETTQLWWVTLGGVVALSFAVVVRGEYRTTRPAARLEPKIAPLPR